MRKSAAILLAVAITAGSGGCGGNPGTPAPAVTTPASVTEPPATGIPGADAVAYLAAMTPAANAVGTAIAGIPAECGPSNVPECRDALRKVHDANAGLEKALAGRTVPGCLREADAEMHRSTELMDQGMHDWLKAMDEQDFAALNRLDHELGQASAHQARAFDLLTHSSC
ncbi:hypothetical protein [Amycolatopsis sp. NPDC021455]|uniref:hypothetical protein n=1 Tax=Amycolatopsis sp. NPDC021455 TaxID=3154901 RepID=UPI0033D3E43D